MTSDPNTLFRGNTLVTKMVDEFMKLVGLSYLRQTLQCCIDEVRGVTINMMSSLPNPKIILYLDI